jgi:hypothetical protein
VTSPYRACADTLKPQLVKSFQVVPHVQTRVSAYASSEENPPLCGVGRAEGCADIHWGALEGAHGTKKTSKSQSRDTMQMWIDNHPLNASVWIYVE